MTDPETGRDPLLPDHFGGYRVIALLGEGGMGTVYEAEQQNPKRLVALKVIRAGFASGEVLRRFEHEAAVLARLQHPGIAQIHEAGTFTATGGTKQPYFAMELVRGVPLTEYAKLHELGTDQRLDLMVRICEAVEHAHQRGIVHRDLKPANILVDETGQPKILDFGLARLTDSDVQMTMHTDLGQLVGTLPYMSPEQASGEPDEMDTRSDVYALGVISYELLSGRLPHDLHRRMLPEAVRMIREELPSRLSSIDRNLRGDVETIVGKALEKDKTRRYQSAGELASDIQRYLRNEAISARPASTWYQLRKFARRNRILVGGVLATFVALVAGLVVSAIQYNKAADARDLAETRRQEATDAGDEARAINDFLLQMLGSADLTSLGRDAKVSQALDAASATVGTSFAGKPHVELGVREILARTYESLGMYEEALPHAQRTVELATQLEGKESSWRARGLQHEGICLGELGDHAAAVTVLREASDISMRIDGPAGETTMGIRMDFANQLRLLDQLEESETVYRSVLDTLRANPRDGRKLQVALNSLAVMLHQAERPADAEPLYRESAEIAERLFGPDDPDTLIARFNWAQSLASLRNTGQAETVMAEVLPRMRTVFGNAHVRTATAAHAFGRLYAATGRPREALPLLQEAVDTLTRVQGEGTLDVANYKHSLANTQRTLGDFAAAAQSMRAVLDVYLEHGQTEDRSTIIATSDLAYALNNSGHRDEAEALYLHAIEIASRVLGPDDKQTIICLNSYGVLLQSAERYEEAALYLDRALEALRRSYPPDDPDTAISLHNRMRLDFQLGHKEEAVAQLPDVLARFEKAFGPRNARTAQAKSSGAVFLRDLGRYAEAEELTRSALDIRREVFGEQHFTVGQSLRFLGQLRLDQGDAEGALASLGEAQSVFESAPPTDDFVLPSCHTLRGAALAKQGRYAEAEPLLLEGERGMETAADANAKDRRDAIERVVALYSAWNAAEPSAERAQQLAAWQARLAALDAPPAPDSPPGSQ